MKIGRLEFGIAKGFSLWGCSTAHCGCKFLDLGRLYFTWFSNDCICDACKMHACKCPQDWPEEKV